MTTRISTLGTANSAFRHKISLRCRNHENLVFTNSTVHKTVSNILFARVANDVPKLVFENPHGSFLHLPIKRKQGRVHRAIDDGQLVYPISDAHTSQAFNIFPLDNLSPGHVGASDVYRPVVRELNCLQIFQQRSQCHAIRRFIDSQRNDVCRTNAVHQRCYNRRQPKEVLHGTSPWVRLRFGLPPLSKPFCLRLHGRTIKIRK